MRRRDRKSFSAPRANHGVELGESGPIATTRGVRGGKGCTRRSWKSKLDAVPASDDTTFDDQNVLDLSLGRSFGAGPTEIRIDLQLFNVFNNDAHDSWQTLILRPGDEYYPSAYVLPRRLGLRFGISF